MVQTYYDTLSPSYLELYEQEQRQKIEEVLNLVNINDSKSILDVGCGAGLLQRYVKNYVGVDLSFELLKKFEGKRVVGTGFDLPFKDKSFDYIFCVTVLQDVKDKIEFIKEMNRVGKKLIITVFKRMYSPNQVKSWFKKAGLKVRLFRELEKDFLIII